MKAEKEDDILSNVVNENLNKKSDDAFYSVGDRKYKATGGKNTIILILLSSIFLVAFTLFALCGVLLISSNAKLSQIKEDLNAQIALCQSVENIPNNQTSATIKNITLDSYSQKYYIEYEITYTEKILARSYSYTLNGKSYAIYSSLDLVDKGYSEGRTNYTVGLDRIKSNITSNTKFVPMDYLGITINDVGDTLSIEADKKNDIKGMIMFGALAGAFVIIIIIYSIMHRHNYKEVESTSDLLKKTEPIAKPNKKEEKVVKDCNENMLEGWICPFCNTTNKSDVIKCRACGAYKDY